MVIFLKAFTIIKNDHELKVAQERIIRFQNWLVQIRKTARSEEFIVVTGGYRLEIERMYSEVIEYLLRPIDIELEKQIA